MVEDTSRLKQTLIDIQVVQSGEFVLASGKKSNYFVNIKRASTDPRVLKEIARVVAPHVGNRKVAGMALGAVPIAVAVALETGMPYVMVRRQAKDHGTKDEVEGDVVQGEEFVVVEDVATTGGSTLKVVEALKVKGAVVTKAVVVVDREEGARELLSENGVELVAIFKAKDLT
ncbi:MAG: orotate phosphoribosyltransferase [Methanobacteriota archaeon]|nr:MAG: orotate phosphoribosyltransferase [Euryarchaeota archaeon]